MHQPALAGLSRALRQQGLVYSHAEILRNRHLLEQSGCREVYCTSRNDALRDELARVVQEIQQKGYSCNAWSSILFFSAGRITGALQSPRSKSRFVTAKFSPRQRQCSPVSALGALYRSCKLHLCRKAAGSHEVLSSWFNPLVLSKLIYLQIISISPSRFHSWCAQMGTWWGTSMTHSFGSVSGRILDTKLHEVLST